MTPKYKELFEYREKQTGISAGLRRLYFSFKNRFIAEPTIFLNKNPKYRAWQIGDYTYGSRNGSPHIVYYGEPVKLVIGKFCSIADEVTFFLGGNHQTKWVTTFPFNVMFSEAGHITGHPFSNGDIVIGNDVWIGEAASIMSGLSIGNGAVIAANSVVTGDVPAYGIVAGNPARLIGMRFEDEQVKSLEKIAWWHWGIDKILENIDLILNKQVDAFIEKHYPSNDEENKPV